MIDYILDKGAGSYTNLLDHRKLAFWVTMWLKVSRMSRDPLNFATLQLALMTICVHYILQLEPYMDETFIENAFAQMGETTTGVKLIKNKHTR